MNIQIMRAFIRIRRFIASHNDLRKKINELEKKLAKKMEEKFGIYDKQFKVVFKAFEEIKELLFKQAAGSKRRIGFHPD